MSTIPRALPTCLCLVALASVAVPVRARAEPMIVAPLCEGPRMREATDTLAIYESERGRSTRLVPHSVSNADPCLIGLAKDRAAMLAFGRSRFDALDFDEATRTLNGLVDTFERLPALDNDLNVLNEARAYLAWAARERKDMDTARAQLRAACVSNPKMRLDSNRFPPAVVALSIQVCREATPTGIIDVSGLPAEAHVLVDDTERCTSSCVLTVPVGLHFVSVRTSSSRNDVKIDVAARATHHVYGSPNATVAERMRTAIAHQNAVAVGQDLGDGDAIVVMLDESASGIEAWTTRPPFQTISGPTLIIDAEHPADAARSRAAIDAMIAALPLPVLIPQAQVRSEQPIYGKWWLWTGLGIVAAGTVTAIAVGSSHGGGNDVGVRVRLP